MSQIPGPARITGSPGQSGISPGTTPAAVPPPDRAHSGPGFAEGSLWAAQVASVSPRGFVLLVGGQAFDVDGRAPVPSGTPLLVRARTEHGLPVFEVVPVTPTPRAAEALRLALGHLLRRALGADALSLPPAAVTVPAQGDLAAALAHAIRDRLSEPSAAVADYLSHGILRLELPLTTTDAAATWHLEIDPDAPGDGGEDQRTTSIALFATLPDTGPVEARLVLTGDDLSVRLVLAGAEACARVENELGALRASLLGAGFRAVHVTAVADPAQLARDRATDAVPHETPTAGGLLDVRA